MFHLFKNRTRYLKSRVWRDSATFTYPESSLQSLAGKSDFGIAFSGGGTRSAAATIGQLRGLKKSGLLEQVKYISAVSGGTWTAAPFTFLPDNFDEDEFLGDVVEPAKLDIQTLRDLPKRSMVRVVSESVITDDFLAEAAKLAGDEAYSRAIGNVFLDRFDLDSNKKFMTFDQETLTEVLARNPRTPDSRYHLEEGDFYTARKGRAFFVAGATIFSDQKRTPKIHTEFTPYYSGTRNYFNLPEPIGGGYVESVGFDSHKPKRVQRGLATVKLGGMRHHFAISDMIGTSGAAPQELLHQHTLDFLGFPEFRTWAFRPGQGFTDDEELSYGDGGHLENLGIMPLLARGVRHIIVFVNSKTEFKFDSKIDKCRIASSIPNLFKPASDGFRKNLVIKDNVQHTKYKELLQTFEDCNEAGAALIHRATYDIKANKSYSIKAYSGVTICWVYNQRADNWFQALPFHLRKMITNGEVERFPHYRTFFQNPPRVFDLSRAEAGLLAHLSCWAIATNEDLLAPGP